MYLQVPAPDLRFSASAVGHANTSPKIDPSFDPSFSNLDLKLFTVFAFAVTLSNKSYLKTTRYEKKYFDIFMHFICKKQKCGMRNVKFSVLLAKYGEES